MGVIAGIGFGQASETSDPRELRNFFEDALRASLQPGGSVIVTNACDTNDIDGRPITLPDAKNRMSQIAKANPAYLIVTSSEVTNYLRTRITAHPDSLFHD